MRHRLMTHPLFFISITAPFLFLLLLPFRFYSPHTPYKQPPEAWSLPLIPHYRKTHLQLTGKNAKFAEKY